MHENYLAKAKAEKTSADLTARGRRKEATARKAPRAKYVSNYLGFYFQYLRFRRIDLKKSNQGGRGCSARGISLTVLSLSLEPQKLGLDSSGLLVVQLLFTVATPSLSIPDPGLELESGCPSHRRFPSNQ